MIKGLGSAAIARVRSIPPASSLRKLRARSANRSKELPVRPSTAANSSSARMVRPDIEGVREQDSLRSFTSHLPIATNEMPYSQQVLPKRVL
jgi:hypothetical protein